MQKQGDKEIVKLCFADTQAENGAFNKKKTQTNNKKNQQLRLWKELDQLKIRISQV